jgi:hypothetical protein
LAIEKEKLKSTEKSENQEIKTQENVEKPTTEEQKNDDDISKYLPKE